MSPKLYLFYSLVVRSSKIDNYYRFLLPFRTTVRVKHLYVEANFLLLTLSIQHQATSLLLRSARTPSQQQEYVPITSIGNYSTGMCMQYASLHLAMDGHYLHVTTVENFFIQKSASDKIVKVTKNILRCVNAVSRRERMSERERT